MPPINLQVAERAIIYQARRKEKGREAVEEAKVQLMINWQRQWDTLEHGRWTHRLIRNVTDRVKRKHGDIGTLHRY